MRFQQFVARATGVDGADLAPYDFQQRLADDGLPELLSVPTGAGKTMAAVLPWLYRRLEHAEQDVRVDTPRWLVVALPMRVLVEQTVDQVREWIDNLGLGDHVAVYELMGGEDRGQSAWRYEPHREAIFVGTIDMFISRVLNRGYGEGRFTWPIDFGLFNNGCQWVFDEVQLMGPALPTSRQLEGLRRKLGTAMPCRSMWMSATIPEDSLGTVDLPDVESTVGLSQVDLDGPLRTRLNGERMIEQLSISGAKYEADLAAAVLASHRPGTRTIAVVNTVERARKLHEMLGKSVVSEAALVLVHSRFRPGERRIVVDRALAEVDPAGPGVIVVSTQVLEAGVDVSSATMVTEVAPWPSIVQRSGRCNRDGTIAGARLLWVTPPKPAPYDAGDLEASIEVLLELEGQVATPLSLGARSVVTSAPIHQVLRRRDMADLFDTTPDLGGADIDVSRFIRDAEDTDVSIAWREIPEGKAPDEAAGLPAKDERCPVPLSEARGKKGRLVGADAGSRRRAWWFDHLAGTWVPVSGARDIVAGGVLLVDAKSGGYRPDLGWAPESKEPVPSLVEDTAGTPADTDLGVDAEPLSVKRPNWVGLRDHLADVEAQVHELVGELEPPGLSNGQIEAALVAGRLHDIGKAHETFQDLMKRCAGDGEWTGAMSASRPFAKAGGTRRPRYKGDRQGFRHELASALALTGPGGSLALEGLIEQDLTVYLVAAHHGRVRMGIRSLPSDVTYSDAHDGEAAALGVHQGDVLPEVLVPGGVIPESVLDLSTMGLGAPDGGVRPWADRAIELRDRADLGPFRLGFLEAVVRLADWRASASAEEVVENG